MEKHGIGTDASMAVHINNICERDYVRVTGQGRKLVPSNLGLSLINGYNEIDKDLSAPELRSGIERSVALIAKVIDFYYLIIFMFFLREKENLMMSLMKQLKFLKRNLRIL